MSSEHTDSQMTIENLQLKVENQQKLIGQLTNENEELYHQYNHLMIRNGKMLKRVDDLQKIIDDLHIRIEELQLINGNMLQLNDRLRKRTDTAISTGNDPGISGNEYLSPYNDTLKNHSASFDPSTQFDLDVLYDRWRAFPGQVALNAPNLRKQVLMMVHLYNNKSLRASELFNLTGVGGVTGARYVSSLKKFGLIRFTGARKKGSYEITNAGTAFIESKEPVEKQITNDASSYGISEGGIPVKSEVRIPEPATMDHNDL
ncbi:MAG: hypothetical protein IPG90_14445 [Bacteroidetes bacterium]|nr:hypothetical protein [Bacteroidota bacterium]MBK6839309.1 hypothetical protein [Bacteroidota bacterium]MBK9524287.1 hypothetical protein [Bacteroidota bacterium]